MAVVVVTATATVATDTVATSVTGTLPASIDNDDVLIALVVKSNTADASSSNGYTAFTSSKIATTTGQDIYTELWYKVITDKDSETNPVWTWTGNANAGVAVFRVTGLDLDDLEDGGAQTVFDDNVDTTFDTVAAVSLSEADNLNICCCHLSHGTGGDDATVFTVPSGMTLVVDNYTPNHTQLAVAFELSGLGSTGTRSFGTDAGPTFRQEGHQINLAFTAEAGAAGSNITPGTLGLMGVGI